MKFYTFAVLKRILNAHLTANAEASTEATEPVSDVQTVSELPLFPLFPRLTCREELIKRILYLVSLIDPPIDETPSLLVWLFPNPDLTRRAFFLRATNRR